VEDDPELAENKQWEAAALAATIDVFVAEEQHQQEAERQRREAERHQEVNAWRLEAHEERRRHDARVLACGGAATTALEVGVEHQRQ
jgi:hypothetical protein